MQTGNNGGMKLTFYGAAGEVTGSRHLLTAGGAQILMDCGMFQGHRGESLEKNRKFPFRPSELDAAIMSHAHIDHIGGLPLLAKKGLGAPVYCTGITKELAGIMLMDSARLQEADAKFFNKIHAAEGRTIEPLYNEDDARLALSRLKPCGYGSGAQIAPGVSLSFINAGHVLGSAMVQLDIETVGASRRLLYTGDLGRRSTIMMAVPKPPPDVDYLIIETTYGNRLHEPAGDSEAKFREIIERAIAEKGKIIIPSFALERTQEIIFILDKLRRSAPELDIPVYVDSPMAVSITEIFNRHKDGFDFDPKFREYVKTDGDPFGYDYIRYVRAKEESQKLNDIDGPMIIISASGMCEGGRVLHHLRSNIDKDSTAILLVGYQAAGTLGRRLQEGARKVKIFGLEHEVAAGVETIHAFSSHADKDDLLAFIKGLNRSPRKIFLVHGDPKDRAAFADHLKAEGVATPVCPEFAQEFPLD